MNILIAGNLANTGFYLTSQLINNKINAELLMENNPKFESDPKNSGFFEGMYPNWIRFFDKKKSWKFQIIKIMKRYDIIGAATEFPIFALFSFKPFVAIATGSDLYELAHKKSLKGLLLKLAYKKAKVVVFTLPSQISYVKKLKLKNATFLPLFRKEVKSNKELQVEERKKFVIFHPTNHLWDFKKNDIFLKSFIKLAKSRDDVFLITINRGVDAEKSIELLKNADIEGKYEIISKTLNQDQLYEYYQNCDIVADQFGIGSFGYIGQEILKLGKPLMCYIEKDNYEKLYGEKPPVLSSQNVDELVMLMNEVITDKTKYQKVSLESKRWYEKYHSETVLIKKYISLFKDVYTNKISNIDFI